MSAQADAGNALTITGRRCRYCGHGEVTPAAIEAYDATAGAAGIDHAGAVMREALVRRGITIAHANNVLDRCPCCESEQVIDYSWKLDGDGQVVPATTTPLKETG